MDIDYFNSLPWDVIVRIFSFLPPQEVPRMSAVCKLFRDVVHSTDLWSEYVGSNDHSFVNSRLLLRHLEDPAEAVVRRLYDEIQSLRGTNHELIHSGVACSSKDSDEQDIDATLKPGIFWSSTGSATPDADEWLVYRLREPISVVFSVVIEPYRALYQTGTPMYSPRGVSFSFGFSKSSWHYTTPVYPVDPHEPRQRFELTPQLCVGEYVRVNLHGKREIQPADNLYYTVLDRVYITGALFGAIAKGPLCDALMGFGMSHAALAQRGSSPAKLAKAMAKEAQKYIAAVKEREAARETYVRLVEQEKRNDIIAFLAQIPQNDELRSKNSLQMLYGIKALEPPRTRVCAMLTGSRTREVPLIWECLCANLARGKLNPAESVAFLLLSKLYGTAENRELFMSLYAFNLRSSAEIAELFQRLGMFDFAVEAYAEVNHFGKVFELFMHMKKYRMLVDFSVRSLFKPDWDAVIEHAARYGTENQRLKLAFSLIFPKTLIHAPPGAVVPEGAVLDELDRDTDNEDIIVMNGEVNSLKVVGLPLAPMDVLTRLRIEMPLLNLLRDLQERIFATITDEDEHPLEMPPEMTQDELQKTLDDYFESNDI